MNKSFLLLFTLFLGTIKFTISQNETSKWYFGKQAALDFMPGSPIPLYNNPMITGRSSASIADASGNLLFYTDGTIIYNSLHVPMANGTGIAGNPTASQPAFAVKQPGSNSIYYLFTQTGLGISGFNGLYYSIIDMNLAGGTGSVTTKNIHLFGNTTTNLMSEKLTGTMHCNNVDIWILTHEFGNSNFHAYLLTAAGLNTNPVISTSGSAHTNPTMGWMCPMKISPNKRKAIVNIGMQPSELFDFDPGTGIFSNPLMLPLTVAGFGCEFSRDNSKVYISTSGGYISQYNLCAGSPNAVLASLDTIADPLATTIPSLISVSIQDMQLAKDGKIYFTRALGTNIGPSNFLSVINNPNLPIPACGYVVSGISIAPINNNFGGLPCFLSSYFNQSLILTPITYSLNSATNCNALSFFTPNLNACAAIGYSISSLLWNFGDPSSGSANNSTLSNPTHTFSSAGTYTIQLILNFNCISDTLEQVVTINPSFSYSINIHQPNCYSFGSASITNISNPTIYNYLWSPTNQTTQTISNLIPGSYTVSVSDNNNCTIKQTFNITQNNNLSAVINTITSTCQSGGINFGANITPFGAAGPFNYSWSGSNQTSSAVTNLMPGPHSVTISNQYNCSYTSTFQISVPQNLPINSLSSLTVCEQQPITLTSNFPALNYNWSGPNNYVGNGQTLTIINSNQTHSGNYTLTTNDNNNCFKYSIKNVSVISIPDIAIQSSKNNLCPPFCTSLSVKINTTSSAITNFNFSIDDLILPSTSIYYCFNKEGIYKLNASVVDYNGCVNSSNMMINVLPKPIANFEFYPKKPIVFSEKVDLINTSEGKQQIGWQWYFNDLTNVYSIKQNENYIFENEGEYPIFLITTNVWGCKDTIRKVISVMNESNLYLPNSFTPNGDGKNDTFYPKGTDVSNYQLQIFNRWGEIIFETKDIFTHWDGTYKGKECKSDVYTWKMNYKGLNGRYKELTGHVNLMR